MEILGNIPTVPSDRDEKGRLQFCGKIVDVVDVCVRDNLRLFDTKVLLSKYGILSF